MDLSATAATARRFVGRHRELADLESALHRAADGVGGLYLLTGEPGIGKTRLALELAHIATGASFSIHWGRCWDGGGAPAYWPWVQILRSIAGGRQAPRGHEAADFAEISRIVPELGQRKTRQGDDDVSEDRTEARFRLFDAVVSWLVAAAKEQPLLLILDDLHDGDGASLLLLRFVARHLPAARILVIASYREVEVRQSPEMGQLLAATARDGRVLPLRGLGRADVERLVTELSGEPVAASFVDRVYGVTRGLPYFVDAIVGLAVAEARSAGRTLRDPVPLRIPDEIKGTIRQRLGHLPPNVMLPLQAAAVIGHEFEVDLLAGVCGLDADQVSKAIEACVDAGILTIPGSRSVAEFQHTLVRETLYAELPADERRRLHTRVAEAIEAADRGRARPRFAEIATHLRESAQPRSLERAFDFAVRAGDAAHVVFAFDSAAEWYAQALGLPDADGRRATEKVALLRKLGDAHTGAGRRDDARAAYAQAAAGARDLGDAAEFARAALALAGPPSVPAGLDIVRPHDNVAPLLEEALRRLEPGHAALQARLEARLAVDICDRHGPSQRTDAQTRAAVELAEASRNVRAHAYCLSARHVVLWGPGSEEVRLAVVDDLLAHAAEAEDIDLAVRARAWRVLTLLELGSVAGAELELAEWSDDARGQRHPMVPWYRALFGACLELQAGRFATGEALANEAMQAASQVVEENAFFAFGTQYLQWSSELGRIAELRAPLERLVESQPTRTGWRAALAFVYSGIGRAADAQAELDRLAADDFGRIPRTALWTGTLCLLAEVCASDPESTHAETIYRLLLPYAGRNCIFGAASLGPVAFFLGRLASRMGRAEDAARHFDDALALATKMGARPFAAHALVQLAGIGSASPSAATRGTTQERLREASTIAAELGMQRLLDRIATVGAVCEAAPAGAQVAAPRDVIATGESAAFLRSGDYWTISFAGVTTRLRDTKGLRHLAFLLRHPNVSFSAIELAAGMDTQAADGGSAAASQLAQEGLYPSLPGDAGEVIDARARRDYESRLKELRAEFSEAEQCNDPGRAQRAREEIDALARQVAGALGLQRRDRRVSSDTERARVTVTKRIKAAIHRIDSEHPALAHFLAGTVRTGYTCTYVPPPSHTIEWDF